MNGGWSKWGNWSECSAACGTGTRSRVRLCDNPVPVGDGKPCTGEVKDTEPCSSDSICLCECLHLLSISLHVNFKGVKLTVQSSKVVE